MKNMDVVPVSSRGFQNFAADSRANSSPSIEDLRKKYLSEDYQPAVNPAADSRNIAENDDIEIGLLRKKNSSPEDSLDDSSERTIINSKDKGIIGSQG
ncbi:hypothetical protein ACFQZI_14720 [Mucilaginibacter lutimaris]|uniref:Uncharacterized protein n=1 Tax=Mucilaginibacter lutimaris TaxID=931629 RepID=A0ABW2ZIY0_9SPHI